MGTTRGIPEPPGARGPSEADRGHGWLWTDWIRTGRARWRRVTEKFLRVPSEIKDRRYAICQQCEHFVPATTQCRKCYCAMGLKAWYAELACPDGKWGPERPPGSGS